MKLTRLHLGEAIGVSALLLVVVCLELFSFQSSSPLFTLLHAPLSFVPVSALALCPVPLSLLLHLSRLGVKAIVFGKC